MDKILSKSLMEKALRRLDELLNQKLRLIIGGGGAMILAHNFPIATTDLDAVPKGMTIEELDPLIKKIGLEMNWPGDWMNPYFASFAINLPSDFGSRMVTVFNGKNLIADALGREDMLIMKCFAHRAKDIGHARALLKAGADTKFVEKHIEALKKKKLPGCDDALEFLDQLLDDE